MILFMMSYLLFCFMIIMMIMFMMFFYMNMMIIMEWNFFIFNSVKFCYLIYLDYMSLMFIFIVLLISFLVLIYSNEYMEGDYNINRFSYLVFLFILSMIFMIISPNILSILLGWDGLGLISYCLVIYYQNYNALNSGLLTIFCNRIGDVGILMLISMSFMFGSFNLFLYKFDYIMVFLLILIAFTKSAQIPFSLWLPAAMMAPTPVSSLVHSSTLVTAGVYLLIRYNKFLFLNNFNEYIFLFSGLTMFMAGLIANYEYDFKKIIALSTLSQLGLMMSILSLGFWEISFFHLIIHALFKSLMFLCAGSFIHYFNNNQDIRMYGGILSLYPFKSMILIFSSLCLMGFPFLSGYYSKDLIMEMLFFSKLNFFSVLLMIFSTIFTVSYSIRLIMYMIFNNKNYYVNLFKKESNLMNFCMMILFMFVIMFGFIMYKFMFFNYNIILTFNLKFLVIKLLIYGFILGILFFNFMQLNYIGMYMNKMFFMNKIYKLYFFPLNFIKIYDIIIEKNLIEFKMMFIKLKFYMNFYKIKEFNLLNMLIMNLIMIIIIFILI